MSWRSRQIDRRRRDARLFVVRPIAVSHAPSEPTITYPQALRILRSFPGIDDRHTRSFVIATITGNHRKTVVQRRRGDNQVRLRKRVSRLPAFLDQNSPPEHDLLSDR